MFEAIALLWILLIFLILVIIILLMFFALPLIKYGAPFEGTKEDKVKKIILIAHPNKRDIIADLGSGDGRIVIEFAKQGIEAHGYEINPLLIWISRRKIKKLSLQKKAFIHRKNFWKENLSKYSIITMFQYKYFMNELEKKLKKELKSGSKVVSNHWKFPTLRLINKIQDIYLYKIGKKR